jgi:hypothetical protein
MKLITLKNLLYYICLKCNLIYFRRKNGKAAELREISTTKQRSRLNLFFDARRVDLLSKADECAKNGSYSCEIEIYLDLEFYSEHMLKKAIKEFVKSFNNDGFCVYYSTEERIRRAQNRSLYVVNIEIFW